MKHDKSKWILIDYNKKTREEEEETDAAHDGDD